MSLKIAYLVNQYPKVSHSFIRREIIALEAQGIQVFRFSIRTCPHEELVDEADKQELAKTQGILDLGLLGLLLGLFYIGLIRPIRLWQALKLTLKVGWRSDRGMLLHFAYLTEACVLLRWFTNLGIDHVHAHFGTNSTTVAMLCRTMGGPSYSFTIHGPEEFDKATVLALAEKINYAEFVVAISSFGQSQLYRWCQYEQWSKIHVVRCGVDELFLSYLFTPAPDRPQLVCIGRLCEQKGQLLLIKAAAQLALEGLQFKLILVGDGPLRDDIQNLAEQLGLQNYVEITGWASNVEVKQHILASRAMVLPSFAEGLPVVIMEALALGRPAICTYVAGIPELVEPGVSGWLVSPGSVEALTNAMRTALQLPVEKLEQMGRVGAFRVAQQHDAEVEASKLATLFRSNIKKSQNQAINIPPNVVYASIHKAKSN